jgi:patatin-like phospholipase/acyl hydrolase
MNGNEMTNTYRVLSLDGGGLRGIFTAAVLADAEDAFGPDFISAFDLLVGTSTGGIIALGLASGRTCAEMLDFYRSAGPEIFSKPRAITQAFRPKYDRKPLDEILRKEFGASTRMNDLSKPVCITAYELTTGTTRVWKDDHAPELRFGGGMLVWKIAAATSAAPTYFAPVRLHAADSHVDGGVWGNNPVMVGITEAVRYGNRQLDYIRVLSIGTTSRPLQVSSHRDALRLGFTGWARKGLDLIQGSSSAANHQQARLLLGEDHYLRLDSVSAEKIKLDDATQCGPLQEWGHDVGRNSVAAIGRLLEIQRNRPSA